MKHRHIVDDILTSFFKMIHGSVEHEEHQFVFKMSTFSLDTGPESGGPLVNGITNRVDGEVAGCLDQGTLQRVNIGGVSSCRPLFEALTTACSRVSSDPGC